VKRKKFRSRHLILALVITFSITGVLALVINTLAYFRAESTAENFLYSKVLKVDLIDIFDSNKLVLPGDALNKDVSMKNTGELNAVVRIKLTSNWNPTVDTLENTLSTEVVQVIMGNTVAQDWTLIEGWYYYNKVLKPGEETSLLVDEIKLLAVSNDIHSTNYSDATFSLDVLSQSLQAISVASEENWGVAFVADGDFIVWTKVEGAGV